jgi:leucyl-tRNA synthetase
MELIPSNVANFTRQLKRTGAMYDWDHALNTTDPEYYKWTQWIFLKLYEAGLAEKKEAPVNWCPGCNTVLANEQVIAGECERCGTAVEQRFLSQWFFRITDYAQRLLDNLDWIDWSETTKKAQRNWIGKSEGAMVSFPISRPKIAPDEHEKVQVRDGKPVIDVFTTRPDTLFGATFMVLAPEHPAVEGLTTDEQRDEVESVSSQRRRHGPGLPQEDRQGEDGRLHRRLRGEPRHRRGGPRLDRRLRPHGVRHRRHHGRPRPRRAGLRVRREVRAPHRPRRRRRGRGCGHAAGGGLCRR